MSPVVNTSSSIELPYDAFQGSPFRFDDVYDRNVPRLLASLSHFAQLLRDDETVLPNELPIDYVHRCIRICNDSMIPDDFTTISSVLPLFSRKKSSKLLDVNTLAKSNSDLLESLPDLLPYEQVIIPHHVSEKKWIIVFVMMSSRTIHSFCIGDDCFHAEMQITSKLLGIFGNLLPGTACTQQKCEIPKELHKDAVLIALILQGYLHQRRNYLDLDQSTLAVFKLYMLRRLRILHDEWLGKLRMEDVTEQTHPFLHRPEKEKEKGEEQKEDDENQDEQKADDENQKDKVVEWDYELPNDKEDLDNSGYFIIDNAGDGNCGYYSLIFGLENNGIRECSVDAGNVGRWATKYAGKSFLAGEGS